MKIFHLLGLVGGSGLLVVTGCLVTSGFLVMIGLLVFGLGGRVFGFPVGFGPLLPYMAFICSLKCFPLIMLFWSNDASQNMNPPNNGSSFNCFKGNKYSENGNA